jgi:hypothetical protein
VKQRRIKQFKGRGHKETDYWTAARPECKLPSKKQRSQGTKKEKAVKNPSPFPAPDSLELHHEFCMTGVDRLRQSSINMLKFAKNLRYPNSSKPNDEKEKGLFLNETLSVDLSTGEAIKENGKLCRGFKRKHQSNGDPTTVTFHRSGLNLPGEKTHWPRADFELRSDYMESSLSLSNTHEVVQAATETRSISFQRDSKRWFSTRKDAQDFATWSALMCALPKLKSSHFLSTVFKVGPNDDCKCDTDNEPMPMCGQRVHCLSNDAKRYPHFVSVLYSGGGRGYYLTNDFGCRVSGIYLCPP